MNKTCKSLSTDPEDDIHGRNTEVPRGGAKDYFFFTERQFLDVITEQATDYITAISPNNYWLSSPPILLLWELSAYSFHFERDVRMPALSRNKYPGES